jgi:hypothetical protein
VILLPINKEEGNFMRFEIVAFYPSPDPKRKNYGSLHVFITDYNMDFRGIIVKNEYGKGLFFQLPGLKTIDEEGEKVYFPFIEFRDKQLKKDLLEFLKKDGKEYLKKNFGEFYGRFQKAKPVQFPKESYRVCNKPKASGTEDIDSKIGRLDELLRKYSDKPRS